MTVWQTLLLYHCSSSSSLAKAHRSVICSYTTLLPPVMTSFVIVRDVRPISVDRSNVDRWRHSVSQCGKGV